MEVTVESIEQNYSLDTHTVVTWAVLRLPTGERLNVRLEAEQAEAIMQANSGEQPEAEAATYEQPEPEIAQPAVSVMPQEEEMVQWGNLPNDVLPIQIKQVLAASNIDPVLPMSQLVELADDIAERMMAQAQAAVPPDQKPAVVPPPPAKPPMGVVQRRVIPGRKTVPMDAQGYPIVAGIERDPGEVAMDADEDGVGQIS